MKRFMYLVVATFLVASNVYAMDFEHSGSWYYSEQSGHGFSIEVGETGDGTPLVIVYWYTYDSAGNPVFLIGTGNPDENGVEVTLTAQYGMIFGEFDPTTVKKPDAGVAKFTFSDADNGTFEYLPSDWTITNFGHSNIEIPITKLFGVSHPDVVEVPNAVVSWIRGAFKGWRGDTIIELANGQIWQQNEYYYSPDYQYIPTVVIYRDGGFDYAAVEGIKEHVGVKRIQ